MTRDTRKHLLALLVLAGLTSSLYLPALLGSVRLAGFDTLNNFYPWKHFLAEQVRQGRLPLWNPYVFSGMPFAGDTNF